MEFDVRLTADGHAVVMHDADVARTTDGSGLVRDLILAEVKALGIRARDGSATSVPTLDETLAALSGRGAVDIELKNVPGEPDFESDEGVMARATLAALDRTAFVGSVLISSFNPFSIDRVRALAADVDTGLLTVPEVDVVAALSFAAERGHAWVLPHVSQVVGAGRALATRAHEAGVRVGTWLVDDPAEALELFGWGIDAVATNDPARLVAARAGERG